MQPFFLVQSLYRDQPFVHETDLDSTTLDQLVDQLAQGQFDTGEIQSVIAVDLGAGTSADISQEVAQALQALSHAERDPLTENVAAFVARHGFMGYELPLEYTGFLCAIPYREDREAA